MKILGIETATAVCGAALADNGSLLTEVSLELPQVHSEQLISLIAKSLQPIQGNINSLDGIAVSIGPGSFTGLRIGLSTAKGLAYSVNKSIVGVPTLEALAYNSVRQNRIADSDIIMPMLDARRDEVYAAVYKVAGSRLEEITPACAILVSECMDMTKKFKKVSIVGDGAAKFKQFVQKVESERTSRYIIPSQEFCKCSAAAVALLGEMKIQSGLQSDISTLEPLYVKEFYTTMNMQHQKVST